MAVIRVVDHEREQLPRLRLGEEGVESAHERLAVALGELVEILEAAERSLTESNWIPSQFRRRTRVVRANVAWRRTRRGRWERRTGSTGRRSAGEEWLEVTFATPAHARGIRIHEVQGAPSVVRVDLLDEGGGSHTVYSGGDATASGSWLVVPLPLTSYKVAKAKVVTMGQYEAVDAVGLDEPSTETYAHTGSTSSSASAGTTGRRRRSATTGTVARSRRRYARGG